METEMRRSWRTLEEVARELQVSPEAVERLVAAGELAAVRIDGALRFHPSVVKRCGRRAERQATLRRWRRRALAGAGIAAAALACVVTLAVSPPLAGEKVPRQLPYRGYLDLNGAPVTDPQTTMKFELFTTESGGTAAWSEEQSGISVLEGNFSVALGDVVPIPAALFAQPSLYLAITVNGQALQGRQRLLTVPYAHFSAGSSAVPPGTIVAFSGPTIPPGWLLCNGGVVSRTAYPALFAALGYHYGGSGDLFALPDYRGAFLRGIDHGAARDPEGTRPLGHWQHSTTAPPRSAFVARAVSLSHAHNYLDWFYAESRPECQYSPPSWFIGTGGNTDWDNKRCEEWRTSAASDPAHGHAVDGGDLETRPANFAVNWIVRAVE